MSLTPARAAVPVPVALRLFLPESWDSDERRRRKCAVPEEVYHRPKGRIALEELDRVAASGARFGEVLADAAYGAKTSRGRRNPGESVWPICEERASGERKYYLSNHAVCASRQTLATSVKSRGSCEQAHRQMKEELGLDHYEGRCRHGLHHHCLPTTIAHAFFQHPRLKGKNNLAPASRRPVPPCPKSGAG